MAPPVTDCCSSGAGAGAEAGAEAGAGAAAGAGAGARQTRTHADIHGYRRKHSVAR